MDYDYENDDILNPVLMEETNQTLNIQKALLILDIDHNDLEKR